MDLPPRAASAARSVLLAGLVLGAAATPARALRSPGPLSNGHQSLDSSEQCNACHTDGKALSNDKCLGCHEHEPLRRRIAEHKGFHASEKVGTRACYLCHTEHKGRGADIRGFQAIGGIAHFDHQLAGWPLAGAHAGARCEQCHKSRATFLGAPTACDGCHRSPHGDLRASLRKCDRCHDLRSWSPLPRLGFDHASPADTRFVLDGKHAGVECAKCHAKGVFRTASPAPPDCTPCHSSPHTEAIFKKSRCATCHTARIEWSQARFDHGHATRFPLEGQHAKAECSACHLPQRAKTPRACDACHADKDVHGDRFDKVGECGKCHTAKRWKDDMRFDHARGAGFPLLGKHGQVPCRSCHRGASPSEFEKFEGIVVKKQVQCMSCHRHAEVHKRQFRNDECLRCHTAPGKRTFKNEAVAGFHGPDARFPLTEGHAAVACEKCHQGDQYQGTPLECGPACHEDRLHKGSLGATCLRCHEGGHWQAGRFDHDDSSYPLVGHHQDVACEMCHPTRVYRGTTRRCADCHLQDDAHKGTLGRACESCHTPTGRSLFDHNDPKAPERFRLEGKHRVVACKSCHPTTAFRQVATACEGCHAEPAQHRGQLGTRCGECHDVSGWPAIHTGHDVGTFKFGGAHDREPCIVCHAAGRRLRGTGELCIGCHRNDDIHHNSLGPRCGECHRQEAWSGSQVRYFHERSGCDLRGLHRTLPCLDCHVGGNFAALVPTCAGCHRGDAIRAAKDNPKATPAHAGYATCTPCHTANFFLPAPRAGGRESVCR